MVKQEDEIDVKTIIYPLIRQWRWFVLFGALGLAGAFVYNKLLAKPRYSVITSVLISGESTGIGMQNLFQGAIDQPVINNSNLYDQIEIIKSYYNIDQTLLNLNWRTNWRKKDLLIWRGIYNQEPFDVQETADFINPRGIVLYITPASSDNYTVSVSGQIKHNDVITDIEFEEKGTFGRPFINEYFNFTLLKKANNYETPDGQYCFVFNDLNDAILAYQGKLKIDKDRKSNIIRCSIEGEEPVKEVKFLNELVKVYIEGKMNFQNEAKRRSLDFINTQLTGISDSLHSAGNKFTKFRTQNKIINLGTEGSLVMNVLKELESEEARSQMQLDYFRNLLKYLNNTGDLKQLVSPSVVGIGDVSFNAMVSKLGELYNRRQVISFSAKENSPALVLIDKELIQTRNQLNENLRNLIDNATRSIKSQKDRQESISLQLNKLPQKEQQMINIQRQFDLTSEIYTFLLQKRAETNIALASSLSDIQIIDIARPETASVISLPGRTILIIGFILGLFLPLALILPIIFFDDRIRTRDDVENNTNIPILGNIMHSLIKTDLAVFENPKSNIAESFRALRTNLQFMLTGPHAKIISVHSANPGEGKSFVSANLGSILAMNDKKVLLIITDLRKPRLHKIFNVSNEHGLSTYLIGYDTVEQIIFPTLISNLSILPAGPIPPNPAEILGKPEMKTLLDQLRTTFDYIIIDNAPLGLVTDGTIVSYLSDLNIFILRSGISHKHQLEMINQFALKKTINNLAIVVNDIKPNTFGYTYYKYYQYGAYQNTYYTAEDQELKTRWKRKIKA